MVVSEAAQISAFVLTAERENLVGVFVGVGVGVGSGGGGGYSSVLNMEANKMLSSKRRKAKTQAAIANATLRLMS